MSQTAAGGKPQGIKLLDFSDRLLVVNDAVSLVVRGGSFPSQGSNVRSAYRDDVVPTYRSPIYGFRVARTVTP